MKKIFLLLITSLFMLTGCGEEEKVEPVPVDENPIVTMTFEDYGEIKIELYPNEVYNTVANFVTLVEDGFYDGNIINRIQKGFVIQGGAGKAINYSIEGEFSSNGITNNIKHTKGVISMARGQSPDSAGGQFFLMLEDNAGLDGDYAAFGEVIEGIEALEAIEQAEVKYEDTTMGFLKEESYITIEKATVDTKGHEYKVNKIK